MHRSGTRVRKANPASLSLFLESCVRDLGVGPEIQLAGLKRDWKEAVGSTNARNTRPVSLKDGTLSIAVTSPAWMAQARFMSQSFLDAVNSHLGSTSVGVSAVTFVLDTSRFNQEHHR